MAIVPIGKKINSFSTPVGLSTECSLLIISISLEPLTFGDAIYFEDLTLASRTLFSCDDCHLRSIFYHNYTIIMNLILYLEICKLWQIILFSPL